MGAYIGKRDIKKRSPEGLINNVPKIIFDLAIFVSRSSLAHLSVIARLFCPGEREHKKAVVRI